MKVYWSLGSIPELADLPPKERRRLWRECWGKVLWHWPVLLVGFVLHPALLLLVGFVLLPAAAGGGPLLLGLAVVLVAGVIGPVYGFILEQVSIPIARPYLRAARDAAPESGQHADPGAPADGRRC
jgi:hypothetical protein